MVLSIQLVDSTQLTFNLDIGQLVRMKQVERGFLMMVLILAHGFSMMTQKLMVHGQTTIKLTEDYLYLMKSTP